MIRLRFLACALLLAPTFFAHAGDIDPKDAAFFESKVRPLLAENCYKCHAASSEKVRGGLLLDTKAGWEKGGDTGPAIVAGKPDDSLLIEAVRRVALVITSGCHWSYPTSVFEGLIEAFRILPDADGGVTFLVYVRTP